MMENDRKMYCGSCNWCKRKKDGTLICISVDSEYFGDSVIAGHWCDQWEDKCQE